MTDLLNALEDAKKALKDAGKFASFEQKIDIKKIIHKVVQEDHFRTIKFARDKVLTDSTKRICASKKDGIEKVNGEELDQDEFIRICEAHVQDRLGYQRQYTQTRCQNAIQSK